MGDAFATSLRKQFSTWEGVLADGICDLFGCVHHYLSWETSPIRVNGIAKVDEHGTVCRGRKVCFYGPVTESAEAAELFQEWSRSIATMGVARWGGCFRGDGGMYCYGFASELRKKAWEINHERKMIEAKPLPASLPGSQTTAITLADRYLALKDDGAKWLKEVKHINLRSASRGNGYSSGSDGAYREGREHGAAAGFGRARKAKSLPAQ